MRRLELLIDQARRGADIQLDDTGGASDEIMVEDFNEGQYFLLCEIIQKNPDILLADTFIDLVANQESYELTSDLHLGTSIKHVYFKHGSGTADYTTVPMRGTGQRNTAITGSVPQYYFRENNKIFLYPTPDTALTSGLRVTYQKKLRRLDIRRGEISSITKTGDKLDTIVIDGTPTLPKDAGTVAAAKNILNDADKICVVKKDGTAVLNDIPIDSYDESTNTITIGKNDDGTDFETTKTGPDFTGNYIVTGSFSTTHCDLPDDMVERYLITYAKLELLRRHGDAEEYNGQLRKLQAIQQNIIDSYELPDQDIRHLSPDVAWDNLYGYGGNYGCLEGPGYSGGGGGASSSSICPCTVSNVGLDGLGLFKEKDGTTFKFLNIKAETGLAASQDITNDTIDLSLSHLGLESLTDPNADRILFWDDSSSATAWLTLNSSLTISGTELDVVEANIDHDSLQNFVANEHIDHSSVSISTGTGLTGGGDITATRTLSLSHLGLESLADPNADRIAFWDDSAGAFAWLTAGTNITITGTTVSATDTFSSIEVDGVGQSTNAPTLDFDSSDFTLSESPTDDFDITINDSGIDHDATTNFVANEHINHTSVSLTAGEGLTGGGDISASRSFALDFSDLSTTDTAVGAADLVSIHDGAQKKITFANFESSLNHDSLTGFVANEHINWTSASSNFSTSGTITGSSGAVDFGAATSLEIPNGAAPTVNAAGEIAVDTTITDYTGLIKFYDGTEELTVVAMPTGNLSTTDKDVVLYNAIDNEFTMSPKGRIIQQVSSTTSTSGSTATNIPIDATAPQNTEGAEILTVSITPKNTSNRLVIEYNGFWGANGIAHGTAALFQDSTASALEAVGDFTTTAGAQHPVVLRHEMQAGTTSSTTFKIRGGANSGTYYWLRSSSTDLYSTSKQATLTVKEYES